MAQILHIFSIIIMGLLRGNRGLMGIFPILQNNHPIVSSLGAAILSCMFAYDGWIHIGNIYSEIKNPNKDIPKAIIGGMIICIFIYVLINVAYLSVKPASSLANSIAPASYVASALFGDIGGKLVSIGISISAFGALNGYILLSIRVPYTMGLENKLPGSKWLSTLHPKYCTPLNSGLLESIIAILMILTGTFNQLSDLCMFVIWIFYILSFFAMIKLRKVKPELNRPYKTPFYPYVPILAIIGGLYIIISTLLTNTNDAILGIILLIIGLPIYYYRKDKFIKE